MTISINGHIAVKTIVLECWWLYARLFDFECEWRQPLSLWAPTMMNCCMVCSRSTLTVLRLQCFLHIAGTNHAVYVLLWLRGELWGKRQPHRSPLTHRIGLIEWSWPDQVFLGFSSFSMMRWDSSSCLAIGHLHILWIQSQMQCCAAQYRFWYLCGFHIQMTPLPTSVSVALVPSFVGSHTHHFTHPDIFQFLNFKG